MDLLETDLCSLAATGLISRGEEVSLRAAMHCWCSISRVRGGRQDSIARTGIGVEEKQLVVHLWTLLQKVSSVSCIFRRRVKRSEPYRRIGTISKVASWWQR